MSKKSEEVKNEVIEKVDFVPDGEATLIPDDNNKKVSLEDLLKLEKAARVVCIKYDKIATSFEGQHNFLGYNNLEYNELQRKFKKYNAIHLKITEEIESFLDEYFKED